MTGERRTRTTKPVAAIVLLLLLCAATSTAKYSGGSGEPNDPYRIATPNDLNDIANHVEDFNKCFVMVNDINLAAYSPHQFNIIGNTGEPFGGVFDGNNRTISNFTYHSNEVDYIGLFGRVDDVNSEIRNIILQKPTLDARGGNSIGALIGYLNNGAVNNCGVQDGMVSGEVSVGGLVGYNDIGRVSHCYVSGNVSGDWYVGGLLGQNREGPLGNCHATGTVSGNLDAGGLVGNNGGPVSGCYAIATVSGRSGTGGLAGVNPFGEISDCYAVACVRGVDVTGALVGLNYNCGEGGGIVNCYAAGWVLGEGECTGGLVGNNRARVENCYAAATVDGNDYAGGFIGYQEVGNLVACFWNSDVSPDINGVGNNTEPNVVGVSTVQMQTATTFTDAGWDFTGETVNGTEDTWDICEHRDYPRLLWQKVPADVICPYGVDFADFSFLARRWWHTDCADSNDCDAADLDVSGTVDWRDLRLFHDYWLAETPVADQTGIGSCGKYSGGTGSPSRPYLIGTVEDLNDMRERPGDWDRHFTLVADINLAGHVYGTAVIAGDTSIAPGFQGTHFAGTFDGKGHKITALTIVDSETIPPEAQRYLALFGYVRFDAEIRNLSLEQVDVNGFVSSHVGALAGDSAATIKNCYVSGTVSGGEYVGGLLGENRGSLSECHSHAIVGRGYRIGGLVGYNVGLLTNCSATGSVSAITYVGGLSGHNRQRIYNCYATGVVEGHSYVGGLAGYDYDGVYTNSFWDKEVNPDMNGIGNASDPNVIGRTTPEMMTESTFTDAGWDFVGETVNGPNDIWRTCVDGVSYPLLSWEFTKGDLLCPDGVDLVDFSHLANHWQETDCGGSNGCSRTDLDFSGVIDWRDLKIFCDHWLQGL
jgi:hypothetical protein